MKTIWRIIGVIGLSALTLGAVCIVVGLITGGSIDRVINTFFANYDVDYYLNLGQQYSSVLF